MSITEDDFDDTEIVDFEVISVNPNINYESDEEMVTTPHQNEKSVERVDEISTPQNEEDDNSNSSNDTLKKERKILKLEEYKKRRANQKVDEIKPLFDLPRKIAIELCDIPTLPPFILPTDPLHLGNVMNSYGNQSKSYEGFKNHQGLNPNSYEEIVLVSTGCNTEMSMPPYDESNNGGGKTLLNNIVKENKDEILLSSSMSLFSSIQATVNQGIEATSETKCDNVEVQGEHGEDKIIMHLSRNRLKPISCSIDVQTDNHPLFPPLILTSSIINKPLRSYRRRKVSRSRSRSRSYSPEFDHRKYSRYARSQHSTHSSSMYSSSSSSDSENDSDSTYSSSRSSSDSLKRLNNRQNFKFYRSQRTSINQTYKEFREERRVVYIGYLEEETTKEDLRRNFLKYGTIKKISMHAKDDGLRFGFVTFADAQCAYEVIENFRSDPLISKYDIRFGGRRHFCKQTYADLDSLPVDTEYQAPTSKPAKEMSFEDLLNQAKKKLAIKK